MFPSSWPGLSDLQIPATSEVCFLACITLIRTIFEVVNYEYLLATQRLWTESSLLSALLHHKALISYDLFLPSQVRPSAEMEKPCSQTQWKEPSVFRHSPCGPQSPGCSHSLISRIWNRASDTCKELFSFHLMSGIRKSLTSSLAVYFVNTLNCIIHPFQRTQDKYNCHEKETTWVAHTKKSLPEYLTNKNIKF